METHYRNSPVEEELRAKRPASSDEWTANKKRAVSSRTGSPVAANGAMDDAYRTASGSGTPTNEPEKEDDLERFRKAAIFRRMRHYQRENGRAHGRIKQLEESLRLAILERIDSESCWTNTMETIRRLLQLDTIMAEVGENLKPCFPSRIFSSDDLKRARKSSEAKVRAAEKAINAFVRFAGKVERPKYEELFAECQNLQQSNTFLTAEAERTFVLLEEAQKDRDRYLEELRIVQAKVDRLQSRVVNPQLVGEQERDVTPKINGDIKAEAVQDNVVAKKEDTPSATLPSVNTVNESSYNDEEWEARLQIRDDRIAQLEQENAILRDRLVMADSEIKLLGENTIARTPTYRALLDHASKMEAVLKEEKRLLSKAREEINGLRDIQKEWHGQMETYKAEEIEQLKFLLKKRDDDLNRIRQQREQLEAQHKELKAIVDNKRLSSTKYKELAESRGERIELLSSEVRRLKTRLAAASGDEDLLKFLQNDGNVEQDYAEDLKKRLHATETELNTLRATLKDKDKCLVDVASLHAKLESATRQLDAYKNSAESSLVEQLKAKEDELRVLRLKEAQSAQEMTELFSEMDRLSKAWETTDKQAESQAISLEKLEEEKEKLLLAKQKSDNKYYKTMSETDAKDAERKQALRHVEKQAREIEAHQKNEKELLALNSTLSAELGVARNELSRLHDSLESANEIRNELHRSVEEESKLTSILRDQMQNREKEVAELNTATVKLKDELMRKSKEVEKAVQKAKTLNMPALPASERESELMREAEGLRTLLKCSTCQNNFRTTIITKCMHTFCKACVDARISHRSRKCPACNLPFSQSEVQTIYFQ